MTTSKVATMRDAIAELVRDGDTVAIEGFTHLISFAAGHEIIRQRKRDLTLARLTPDVIYDQMIAGGVASQAGLLVARQPGRRRPRRDPPADRGRDPRPAARGRGVQPLRDGRALHGRRDEPAVLPAAQLLRDRPAGRQPADPADRLALRRRDGLRRPAAASRTSTIVHAQRASAGGDTQVWGLLGCQKEAAFAADRVIVVVEELVDEAVIRADPNRTIIPGLIVDAVVVEPWGAHPSYVQGAYDRDNRFYLDWDPITRDEAAVQAWLREWVYDLDGRAAYIEKLGAERLAVARAAAPAPSGSVDYGDVPMMRDRPLMILVAGPYRSGTDGDPARIAVNVERCGRGLARALAPRPPAGAWASGSRCRSIEAGAAQGDLAGSDTDDLSIRIAEQRRWRAATPACGIGGPSEGADRMVATASGARQARLHRRSRTSRDRGGAERSTPPSRSPR